MSGRGQVQPSCAVPTDGSLSPDSFRARRMLLTAESGQELTSKRCEPNLKPSLRRNVRGQFAVKEWSYRQLGVRVPHQSRASGRLSEVPLNFTPSRSMSSQQPTHIAYSFSCNPLTPLATFWCP